MEPRTEQQPDGPLAIDTHCHLFLMDQDPAEVVSAARTGGVGQMVCVGIDQESSRRSRELAESFQGVFATAGVHPHGASGFGPTTGSVIEELLADPLVVAVGETGLDQRRAFRTHVALARESGKPLVVHVRDAWEDALAILADEEADRVVLHCFSGDERVAAEAMARGYFVSFAANITYPNADRLRRAAAAVDERRLLTETDSPFLPPQEMRGQPNHPSNVRTVLAHLAAIRDVNLDRMIEATAQAARSAFPLIP